jgi:hypothetical protein
MRPRISLGASIISGTTRRRKDPRNPYSYYHGEMVISRWPPLRSQAAAAKLRPSVGDGRR